MRILVTGGAGFIGSHLVDRLVADGHDVVVLDNLDPQVHGPQATPRLLASHLAAGRVDFQHGDVRDLEAVTRALEGVDAVCHLAATVGVGQSMYAPAYYTSTNVDGQGVLMQAMLRRIAQFRRFVVASSMSIYGEGRYRCATHGQQPAAPRTEAAMAAGRFEVPCPVCGADLLPVGTDEDKPLACTSIYAETKRSQEAMALILGAAYHLPTVALRFFNVYGSRQALSNPYTGIAAIFMSRIKNGQPPIVFEDGRQSRDFVHVHDLVDGITRALTQPDVPSGVYNLGTGVATTVLAMAETLAAVMQRPIASQTVSQYRPGDIRHCIADATRARTVLGWTPRHTLATGTAELWAWAEAEAADDQVARGLGELVRAGLVR